jgi:hypothetical protein
MAALRRGPAFKLWIGSARQAAMRKFHPEGGWSAFVRLAIERKLIALGYKPEQGKEGSK